MTRAVKRRCAVCSAVVTGRPNKLYCSTRCAQRAAKQRQRNPGHSVQGLGPVPSVIRGTNGVLIATVARLGYLGDKATTTVLDVTYGEGKWWTRYQPARLIGSADDRDKARDLVADFTHLPYRSDSVPIICFDPPYISTGSRATSSVDDLYDRFGLGELTGWKAIRAQMDDGLAECARVLAPGGYLLVKCQDYVESGSKVWNTFHVVPEAERLGLRLVDRAHHLTGGGPQPTTNLDGSPREQKHFREVTSMLMVFTK